jgi:hypothetical protein
MAKIFVIQNITLQGHDIPTHLNAVGHKSHLIRPKRATYIRYR